MFLVGDEGQCIPSEEDSKCLPSLKGHGKEVRGRQRRVKSRGDHTPNRTPTGQQRRWHPQSHTLVFLTNTWCSCHSG